MPNPAKMLRKKPAFFIRTRSIHKAMKMVQKITQSSFLFPTKQPTHIYIYTYIHEGHLESKERFAIQRYLLIIGKKKNMQVL